MNLDLIQFDPSTGLVPAVVQHAGSGKVLMLGYMNRAALEQTMATGKVTFFSRSRGGLWIKGETSGNVLRLVSIADDCDHDAVLVQALPDGPTCHTGRTSCFEAGQVAPQADHGLPFIAHLEDFLRERRSTMPEGSYTTKMFGKGLDKIAQKVGEEAVETVIAAKNNDQAELVYEASDLLFHLVLLMVAKEVPFSLLLEELRRRHV